MIMQRFVLHGSYPDGVWTCATCGAELHSGEDGAKIDHREECREIRGLAKIRELGATIARMQEEARRKTLLLDALHMVWCDGGCASGVHRYHSEMKVTKELVDIAERNTRRLKRWYGIVKWRLPIYRAGTNTEIHPGLMFHATEWHQQRAQRAAAKTDLLDENER